VATKKKAKAKSKKKTTKKTKSKVANGSGGRTPDFNMEQQKEVHSAREGSLRGDCVVLLTGGGTIKQVEGLVRKFDVKRNKKSDTVERRAYELIRIMNFQLGHGVKHNSETGVIKITGRAA